MIDDSWSDEDRRRQAMQPFGTGPQDTLVSVYRDFGVFNDSPHGWYAENRGGICIGPYDDRHATERAVDGYWADRGATTPTRGLFPLDTRAPRAIVTWVCRDCGKTEHVTSIWHTHRCGL